jgi:hypothetical protein
LPQLTGDTCFSFAQWIRLTRKSNNNHSLKQAWPELLGLVRDGYAKTSTIVGCSARNHCGLAVDLGFRSRRLLAVAETTVQLTAERTKASADIRDRLRVLLAEIIKFQSDPISVEMHRRQFDALVEDYNTLERGLAELESREPVGYGFPPRPQR